jgi:hypothetical protein
MILTTSEKQRPLFVDGRISIKSLHVERWLYSMLCKHIALSYIKPEEAWSIKNETTYDSHRRQIVGPALVEIALDHNSPPVYIFRMVQCPPQSLKLFNAKTVSRQNG